MRQPLKRCTVNYVKRKTINSDDRLSEMFSIKAETAPTNIPFPTRRKYLMLGFLHVSLLLVSCVHQNHCYASISSAVIKSVKCVALTHGSIASQRNNIFWHYSCYGKSTSRKSLHISQYNVKTSCINCLLVMNVSWKGMMRYSLLTEIWHTVLPLYTLFLFQ